MATLRNKRKLAAVSRETAKSTRNSRGQNTLDLESTQDYISQVSEKMIEGRVTKKLSKEFSRRESRILGALSKLDELLLNPQVPTCFRSRSGNIQEEQFRKQGNHWGSLLRQSLPQSEIISSSVWSSKQPRCRRLSSQSKADFYSDSFSFSAKSSKIFH